jgi:hypothetical protein
VLGKRAIEGGERGDGIGSRGDAAAVDPFEIGGGAIGGVEK